MTLAKIANLTDSEATIELLRLCGEAGDDERRILHVSMTGRDCPSERALTALEELVGAMPAEERRLQLEVARRLIVLGMRVYGRLRLREDPRLWDVEACAEDVDAVVYRAAEYLAGKSDGDMMDRSLDIMRASLSQAIRRGTI